MARSIDLLDLRITTREIRDARGEVVDDTRTRPPVLAPLAEHSTSMMEQMDPRLWGNLQYHVSLENIFAKLPVPQFFQLRLVCKEWNRLASDQKFLEANVGPPLPKPYFCLVHPDGDWQIILTYNVVSQEWHQLPIPLPYQKDCPGRWVDGFLHILSVGPPLVSVHTMVFNLQTRMLQTLPTLFTEDGLYGLRNGFVANSSKNSFQVIVNPCTLSWQSGNTTSVYDSGDACWKFAVGESTLAGGCNNAHGSICCNGVLYTYNSQLDTIHVYNLVTGEWSSLGLPCSDACKLRLGTWEGRIFAVTNVCVFPFQNLFYTRDVSLRVDEFCQREQVWKKFAEIPEDLSEWLFKTEDAATAANEFKCDFIGFEVEISFCDQYVFICTFLEDYSVTHYKGYRIWSEDVLVPRRFALYNLASQEWKRINLAIDSGRGMAEIEGEWERPCSSNGSED